jgi:hypothetical protein
LVKFARAIVTTSSTICSSEKYFFIAVRSESRTVAAARVT